MARDAALIIKREGLARHAARTYFNRKKSAIAAAQMRNTAVNAFGLACAIFHAGHVTAKPTRTQRPSKATKPASLERMER